MMIKNLPHLTEDTARAAIRDAGIPGEVVPVGNFHKQHLSAIYFHVDGIFVSVDRDPATGRALVISDEWEELVAQAYAEAYRIPDERISEALAQVVPDDVAGHGYYDTEYRAGQQELRAEG